MNFTTLQKTRPEALIEALRLLDSVDRWAPPGIAEMTGVLALCGVANAFEVATQLRAAKAVEQAKAQREEWERRKKQLVATEEAVVKAHNFLRLYTSIPDVSVRLAEAISGCKPSHRAAKLASVLRDIADQANRLADEMQANKLDDLPAKEIAPWGVSD